MESVPSWSGLAVVEFVSRDLVMGLEESLGLMNLTEIL
jgi:hypothetical protein